MILVLGTLSNFVKLTKLVKPTPRYRTKFFQIGLRESYLTYFRMDYKIPLTCIKSHNLLNYLNNSHNIHMCLDTIYLLKTENLLLKTL